VHFFCCQYCYTTQCTSAAHIVDSMSRCSISLRSMTTCVAYAQLQLCPHS
jgi:hypothetical protein